MENENGNGKHYSIKSYLVGTPCWPYWNHQLDHRIERYMFSVAQILRDKVMPLCRAFIASYLCALTYLCNVRTRI